MLYNQSNMASHRKLSKLSINLNTTPSSGRLLKNSRGIHHVSPHTMGNNSTQTDQPSTLKNTPLPRRVPTDNSPDLDSALATPPSQGPVENFTPCVRQNDRFVDPSGNPNQPGTVIKCNKLPFTVSNNCKIYNFTGGSFKQLYITDPNKHKFLASLANSPSTFSSLLSSALKLLGFSNNWMQSNTNQIQPIIETSSSEVLISNNSKNLNVSMDTIPEVDVSDFTDVNPNVEHGNMHDNPSAHETLYEDSIRNTMLTQYNRIVIGSFKEFFQSVDTACYYNMPLEPCQITTEEVPDLVRAHLHHSLAYNLEHSVRGRPHIRGNPYYRYVWQSSPLPRYEVHYKRSDNHVYSNRSFHNSHTCDNDQHVSPQTVRNTPNTSNNKVNGINIQSPNNSDILVCLQSQILGLQTQALQHSTLNSVMIFNGNNKSKFTSWVQSVENAAKLCNLDTLSIALSKLQGPPLKLACFLGIQGS